jgi:hypothetical protein
LEARGRKKHKTKKQKNKRDSTSGPKSSKEFELLGPLVE